MDPDQGQGNSIDERLARATASEPAPSTDKVEGKQPEPTPSSQQKPVDTNPSPEDEEKVALENSKNPERTKAYIDKLKNDLAKAQSQGHPAPSQDYGKSAFDIPQHQPRVNAGQMPGFGVLSPDQTTAIASKFVDQEGNVDIDGLNRALVDSNAQAQFALEQAQVATERLARFEESQQVKEAHAVHPELDPLNKEKFDPKFFELVRDRLVRNRVTGINKSLLDVANEIRDSYAPVNMAKVKQEAVAEVKAAQDKRIQGPIESGRGEPRESLDDLQDLRQRTRRGDGSALSERLRRAGVISE